MRETRRVNTHVFPAQWQQFENDDDGILAEEEEEKQDAGRTVGGPKGIFDADRQTGKSHRATARRSLKCLLWRPPPSMSPRQLR